MQGEWRIRLGLSLILKDVCSRMLRFKVYRDARGLGVYKYFEGRLQRNPQNDADKGPTRYSKTWQSLGKYNTKHEGDAF